MTAVLGFAALLLTSTTRVWRGRARAGLLPSLEAIAEGAAVSNSPSGRKNQHLPLLGRALGLPRRSLPGRYR